MSDTNSNKKSTNSPNITTPASTENPPRTGSGVRNSDQKVVDKALLLMAEYIRKRNPMYVNFPLALIVEIYIREAESLMKSK